MSVSDLDLPLLPSAEQIRRREFRSVRRGYDPDQVRDYLTAVAAQVETLERELREIRLEGPAGERAPDAEAAATEPAPATDPYEELGRRVAAVIATADAEAKRLVDEAKAEASRMLEESRSEADRIRLDAQARAEVARQEGADAVEKAKLEAERTLSNLSSHRETLVTQLHEMQSRLLGVAQDLEGSIDQGDAEVASTAEPEASEETSEAEAAATPGAKEGSSEASGDIVDPRLEDLWVSTETVELPQLAALDLDFDEPTDPDG